MTLLTQAILPISAFALSLAGVRWMLASGVGLTRDVPNDRSLHERVIPRGGGAALVASALAAWLVARWLLLSDDSAAWFLGPIAAMAVLGWADDRFDLGVGLRLAIQASVSVLAALALVDGITGGFAWQAVCLGVIVLSLVWVTNLYNFMDGMDGLAGSQAVIVLSVMAIWFTNAGDAGLALFSVSLAAAAAAFLVFNWHPARVFMGDTGSLPLGMAIGLLSGVGVVDLGLPTAAFVILMGVFLFDATYTLVRRMVRRERWWHSHRSHLYQRASALGHPQPVIVGWIVLIDIVLAALASLIVYTDVSPLVTCLVALAVVAVPALWIHRRESLMTLTVKPS